MFRKIVLASAITVKLAVLGLAGHFFATAPANSDPSLQADCPWCTEMPDCFPGDPCSNCW